MSGNVMWQRGWLSQMRGWRPLTGGIGTPTPHRDGLGVSLEGIAAPRGHTYTPPTPAAPGGWRPTETELAEMGSAVQHDVGPSVAPRFTAPQRLLHATFPVPLPLFLSVGAEPIAPGSWVVMTVVFRVTIGVGRGALVFDTPPAPVPAPVSGVLVANLQLAARTITVESLLEGPPGNFPEAIRTYAGAAYIT